MKEYKPYEGYVCRVDLDEFERKYVMPLDDKSLREIAIANMEGRTAYINLATNQVMILPFVTKDLFVVDDNGHLKKKKCRLSKAQQKLYDDFFEYEHNRFWERVATCEPDSYDEYDTQQSVISCMENFLVCLPPDDDTVEVFKDILRNNREPALELIYNIRRLGKQSAWEVHYRVWKIAELKESLEFYRSIDSEMRDFDDSLPTPEGDSPF